jgi:hypothetical protein
MKEHLSFNVSVPHLSIPSYFYKMIFSMIVAFIIIYPVGFSKTALIFAFIVLSVFFYVILSSITSDSVSNLLPSTTYPPPPHTGLDGISLNNLVAGIPLHRIENM